MPELPEVEVVRRGLVGHALERTVAAVEVLHPRPVRRDPGGADGFTALLRGRRFTAAHRRGKYLWLPTDDGEAMVVHLGMSGQMLVQDPGAPDQKHLRVRFGFVEGRELRFVDQRMFGGLWTTPLGAGEDIPAEIAHIARDPIDPEFDTDAVVAAIRRRRSAIKRILLDQSVISGVGNIYADEALWRARIHGERIGARLRVGAIRELLDHVRDVMLLALAEGGTSFDSLYVNVNGQSGYFDRSLQAYGREALPCGRCATPIRRTAFMNRSSFFCPVCQPRPRSTG